MSEIQNRIKQYINIKNISVREFCRNINVSPSFLARDAEIASDKLLNIVNVYPDISPEWLLTGNGKMLNEQSREPIDKPKYPDRDISRFVAEFDNMDFGYNKSAQSEINRLKEEIKVKDKQVSDLIKMNLYLLEREKEGGHCLPQSAKEDRSAG
jgi:hypothetical protein